VRALLRSPLGQGAEFLLLAAVPLFLVIGALPNAVHGHTVAYDFDRAYLPAAHAVLHGTSPYGPVTHAALGSQTAYVYPPVVAYLLTPLTALPHVAADLVMTALVALALPALLALLGVRDWRCYGAALLWMPAESAIHLGTVSLPLALGVALVWHWRANSLRAGIVLGLVIAVKLFLWPLLLWLVVSRRYRAALVGVASTLAFFLVPWIPLRGAGLASYPHMLNLLSSLEAKRGFSPAALLAGLGSSWGAAQAVGYAIGAAVLVWAAWTGLRGTTGERESLALVLAASLLLTPILWPNYLVVLLVPLALLKPRFGLWWLLPAALLGEAVLDPSAWEIALFLGITAALVAACLRSPASERVGDLAATSARRPHGLRAGGELPASRPV
jgi:alpha-1,2-mannosyltransferase